MAAIAKDSLSPLLKSVNARRRSLEICQTVGNLLLSPSANSVFSSSPTSVHSGATPCKTPCKLSPFKLLNYNESGTSLASSYHCRRRASDSLWLDALPTIEPILKENQQFQKRRASYQDAFVSSEFTVASTSEESSDFDGMGCGSERSQENEDKESSVTVTSNNGKDFASVTCNLIPPTPLKSIEPRSMASLAPLQFAVEDSADCNNTLGDSDSGSSIEDERYASSLDENENHTALKNKKRKSSKSDPSSDSENISPLKTARMISPAVKYDLDQGLIKSLISKWNLHLNPHELLGKGSFGTVIGGLLKGKEVAVKVLNTTTPKRKASVAGEYNALSLPFHSHIARVMEILYPSPNQTLIIMEKMQKGNLLSLLNDPAYKINCSVAINISKQIALALVFCHREGILHLDVKPQNVLVDIHNCCKLSDFGSSKKIANLDSREKHVGLEGTVPYTAPELFKGSIPTEKCDVYGFAISMWQILTRKMPYEGENEHTVIFRVVSQGFRPTSTKEPAETRSNDKTDFERRLTSKYAELYERAWNSNLCLRPSMIDIHKSLIEIQLL